MTFPKSVLFPERCRKLNEQLVARYGRDSPIGGRQPMIFNQSGILCLSSGKIVDVFSIKPCDVSIYDIARSLSHICRFNGHCRNFYSVAQHSLIVSRLVPQEFQREGLLHDAAEAYLGDVPSPLKYRPEFQFFREAEEAVLKVIFEKFNLKWPVPDEVVSADKAVLRQEFLHLKKENFKLRFSDPDGLDADHSCPSELFVRKCPDAVYLEFLETCRNLGIE